MTPERMIELLRPWAEDALSGWNMGTFGAIGEFHRTPCEACEMETGGNSVKIVTDKGALRIAPSCDAEVVAYDTLSSDGEGWSQHLAICVPVAGREEGNIRSLGEDVEAVRKVDRDARLYDLGVSLGAVRMCVRTHNSDLIDALDNAEGKALLGPDAAGVMPAFFAAQPHRVMLSPMGRIEIFQNIPEPDGNSPEGPHTHLLPKLLAKKRLHSANTPIPDGLQAVLNLHPASPWRDQLGKPKPFNRPQAEAFETLWKNHALETDIEVRDAIDRAIGEGVQAEDFEWPSTRRARTQARIALRKSAAFNEAEKVHHWRKVYDRLPEEEVESAEE